jgi:hypothetical protein
MVASAQTIVGQVRLFDESNPPEDVRQVLGKSGPLHLIFQVTPDHAGGSDVLEVNLLRAVPDDTEPGSFNLSGLVLIRLFGGCCPCGSFAGNYHPDRRNGILSIVRNPLPTVQM